MNSSLSPSDYASTVDVIHLLKGDLLRLAAQKGNLDPEVIALSQTIDRYIVAVQKYWKSEGGVQSTLA